MVNTHKEDVRIESMEDLLRIPSFPTKILHKHNAFPDAIFFKGKEYLAFRSAKNHFPDKTSLLIVASRIEGEHWNIEKVFHQNGYDVRDPRFVIFQNELHIYFGVVNKSPRSFRPVGIKHSKFQKDGLWQEPYSVYLAGYLHARVRHMNKQLYMTVYEWNTKHPTSAKCAIVTSPDGVRWHEMTEYGKLSSEGSESDCLSIGKHSLLWVIRNDIGRKAPSGSNIYLIDHTGKILCRNNSRIKFDAPLLIEKHRKIYLLSRYQKKFKGKYRIAPSKLPKLIQVTINMSVYYVTPKTTILSRVDIKTLKVTPQLLIESCGDTGYCAYAQKNNTSFVYTYSSDMDKPNISWGMSQRGRTSIYRYVVNL